MDTLSFRKLIPSIVRELETMSCEQWELSELRDKAAILKNGHLAMKIRDKSTLSANEIEFTGIYEFPGEFAANVRKSGPKQIMRVDRARPGLIATRILKKFRPALITYEYQVQKWRQHLDADSEVISGMCFELEKESGGLLQPIDPPLKHWTPNEPFPVKFSGIGHPGLSLVVTCEHRKEAAGDDFNIIYTFSTESPVLSLGIARLMGVHYCEMTLE